MTTIERLEEKYSQKGRNNRNLKIIENKGKPKYTITYWIWYCDYECYHRTETKTKYFNSFKEIDDFMSQLPVYGQNLEDEVEEVLGK